MSKKANVIFLHHSTGNCIWKGGVPEWFGKYNSDNGTDYRISELAFPKGKPYPWSNYPYDYWNIWVNHAGDVAYMDEPTLEMLAKEYDVIIFKHCYPVSSVKENAGKADVASSEKTIENYKLQYEALKTKLRSFPNTRFVMWTGAALVKNNSTEDNARRAKEVFDWVKEIWDEKGDNIWLWDFRELQTEGGIFFKNEYACNLDDSHPNADFSKRVAPYFCKRIIDVIEGKADTTSLTGE